MSARGPPVFGKIPYELSCKWHLFTNLWLGWEPIFEHEGETLAEMAHEKKVRAIQSYSSQMEWWNWWLSRISYHIAIRHCSSSKSGWLQDSLLGYEPSSINTLPGSFIFRASIDGAINQSDLSKWVRYPCTIMQKKFIIEILYFWGAEQQCDSTAVSWLGRGIKWFWKSLTLQV